MIEPEQPGGGADGARQPLDILGTVDVAKQHGQGGGRIGGNRGAKRNIGRMHV